MTVKDCTTGELVEFIITANEKYRKGEQFISDQGYDAFVEELRLRDPNHVLLQRGIIEQAPSTRKRKLHTQMMSLNKVKTLDEIQKWIKTLGLRDTDSLIITPKYNGISLENNTAESTASTRGDGEYGQNCDEHYKMMKSYEVFDKSVVIGEAIISRENWDNHFKGKLSPKGLPYKLNNATVAGLLNNDTPTDEIQYVDFVRYGIVMGDHSDSDKLFQLQHINSHCLIQTNFKFIGVSEFFSMGESYLDGLYEMWNKEYPIDGLVIEINKYTLREKLGRESNGNPVYARALKLDKWVEEFDTVITGHDFQISKQGKLKGVVTFEPVIINGTEVKQASFYNAKFLRDFKLFKGVNITVKKSGEVIPKIMSVEGIPIPRPADFKSNKEYMTAYKAAVDSLSEFFEGTTMNSTFGTVCPECGHNLVWDSNGVDLECKNPLCESMLVSKLEHFFLTIGMEEFGRPSIQTLFDAGYKDPETIMFLSKEKFAEIPGFGESSVETIQSQFRKIMTEGLPAARILYALDVFDGKIGESTVQMIIDATKEFAFVDKKALLNIRGVSDITADCYMEGLNRAFEMNQFIPENYYFSPKQEVTGDKYKDMSVCFSGIRDASLEEEIKLQGGKIASGVSKTTTHLVVADPNQSTSKTVSARNLGLPILTIEQFKNL